MTIQEMERLMTKIAVMHYIERISQQDIASRLNVSGSKVSRMLARARDEGIVRTYVHSSVATICELESELEREFGLKEAVIVPDLGGEDVIGRLAIAGANTMHRMISRKDVLGISFSHALAAAVHQLHGSDMDGIRVVQMMGVQSSSGEDMASLEISQRLGRIFSTQPQVFLCPGVVASKEICESLKQEPSIAGVLEMATNADIAVVGIGDMSHKSQVFRNNFLSESGRKQLIERGAVGYICMRFYDKDGNICDPELDERAMSVSLEAIRKIPIVISIVSGQRKVSSIRGALRGQLIDILVTDETTARSVLREEIAQM